MMIDTLIILCIGILAVLVVIGFILVDIKEQLKQLKKDTNFIGFKMSVLKSGMAVEELKPGEEFLE